MRNTRDLVATVQGPGWNYGLARVLIDDSDNAVVFVPPGQAPIQSFSIQKIDARGGEGLTAEGGLVRFRRRGASCSYALAKCNTTTDTLMTRWQAWLAS